VLTGSGFGLASLYLPSACIFDLHGAMHILKFFVTFFTLPYTELSLVRFVLDSVD